MSDDVYRPPAAELDVRPETEDRESLLQLAKRQRSLLLAFVCYITLPLLAASVASRFVLLPPLVSLAAALVFLVFLARLAIRVFGPVTAIILMLLSLIPILNLAVLVVVNARASKRIKDAGYPVGLLGGKVGSIEKGY